MAGVEAPKQFRGDGYLVFTPNLNPIVLPWAASFAFRTRQSDGFLLRAEMGPRHFVIVQVKLSLLTKNSISKSKYLIRLVTARWWQNEHQLGVGPVHHEGYRASERWQMASS